MLFNKRESRSIKSRKVASMPLTDGHLLQYKHPGKQGECELVIGLDFGTSASKVVIQAPDLPGRPSFAVDFAELSHESRPYLLPTTLYMIPNGKYSLKCQDGARVINDIKLELISSDEGLKSKKGPTLQNLPPEEVAAIYLALVLRYSRKWLLETKWGYFGDFQKFIWNLNLGVPSPCIEDNEENRIFKRVGKAAWMLSTLDDKQITLERASGELELVEKPKYWETDEKNACDFDIIPEIAAGAVGYALSDLRREGLHVMVDIGAATVDACSFNLNAIEGSDNYSLLIADVKYLGTTRLTNSRILSLTKMVEQHAELLRDTLDPMAPIDEDTKPFLVSPGQFYSADEEAKAQFKREFELMLKRVIWQTKLRRDRNAAVWKKGRLPILLIGGGSKLEFFRSVVEDLNDWLKYYTDNDGITILPAPVPETLTHAGTKVDDNLFLAVTWGLSHRALDVGSIIPADSIPDVEPPRPMDIRSRYVGKELV